MQLFNSPCFRLPDKIHHVFSTTNSLCHWSTFSQRDTKTRLEGPFASKIPDKIASPGQDVLGCLAGGRQPVAASLSPSSSPQKMLRLFLYYTVHSRTHVFASTALAALPRPRPSRHFQAVSKYTPTASYSGQAKGRGGFRVGRPLSPSLHLHIGGIAPSTYRGRYIPISILPKLKSDNNWENISKK